MILIENAVVAAAGYGSRLGKGLPKCMVEISPQLLIIDHIVLALKDYVKNIIIVVGYKGEIIEDYCKKKYPFVIVKYNINYDKTNTAESMALGSKDIYGKCLFLDGDLLFTKNNLRKFLEKSKSEKIILGVTKNITTNPVYVEVKDEVIVRFSRNVVDEYEWANIFCADARILDSARNFVYEELDKYRNLKYYDIDLYEIDTLEDLEQAQKFVEIL